MRTFVLTGSFGVSGVGAGKSLVLATPCRRGDLLIRRGGIRSAEDGAAGDEQRRAGVGGRTGGVRVDAAVDLDVCPLSDQ
jgi:hypothetical protein